MQQFYPSYPLDIHPHHYCVIQSTSHSMPYQTGKIAYYLNDSCVFTRSMS